MIFRGEIMKKYRIIVKIKPNVLDPEGKAIQQAAERMQFTGINSIRVGKSFEVEVEDNVKKEMVEELAKKFLINPIIEIFEIEG